jgi:7-carboxy-7-deazaguanine synthase
MPSQSIVINNQAQSTDIQSDSVAHVTELFSGIQGEGPYVGQRQIFVRFTGCDLRCQWCDTPASLVTSGSTKPVTIEKKAGERIFETAQNPLSVEFLASAIADLEIDIPHHSISLTGGEPLLQANYIKELIKSLKSNFHFKPAIYLETGGHRPNELKQIIDLVDYISFDLKLPSSTADKVLWKEHKEFIEVAKAKAGYAKAVLTDETLDSDLEMACEILAGALNKFDLVLQPAYRLSDKVKYNSPTPEQVLRWQSLAIGKLGRGRVKVIPQTHKFIGQL